MDNRTVGLILISVAVLGLVAVQLLVKTRLQVHGAAPLVPAELLRYVLGLMTDLLIWVAAIILVVAAACWYIGLSFVPLSLAYPFAALSYPLIFLGSLLFLGENFSWPLLAGNVAILAGVALIATSQ